MSKKKFPEARINVKKTIRRARHKFFANELFLRAVTVCLRTISKIL